MTAGRIPIDIPVEPWYRDHCFRGKVIFPAVETMLVLANWTSRHHPGVNVRTMTAARFPKFLEIPSKQRIVSGLIESDSDTNASIRSTLASKIKLKTCSKLQIHGELVFPNQSTEVADVPLPPPPLTQVSLAIDAERIYRELVPFGPAYQTLTGQLLLSERGAVGTVQAPPTIPAKPDAYQLLGSPFPLDGALHAACVCGQRVVDFIPFPTGFDRRVITKPTIPGRTYTTRVELLSVATDELVFTIWITADDGTVYEVLTGIRMRDVSRSKIQPPAWLRAEPSPRTTAFPCRPWLASEP